MSAWLLAPKTSHEVPLLETLSDGRYRYGEKSTLDRRYRYGQKSKRRLTLPLGATTGWARTTTATGQEQQERERNHSKYAVNPIIRRTKKERNVVACPHRARAKHQEKEGGSFNLQKRTGLTNKAFLFRPHQWKTSQGSIWTNEQEQSVL